MFALYQSDGPLLGVGETIEATCEDAQLVETLVLNALGQPVDLEAYDDFARVMAPGGEVPGELYLRRCTWALFEAARDTPPPQLGYYVRGDGVVALTRPALPGGKSDAP